MAERKSRSVVETSYTRNIFVVCGKFKTLLSNDVLRTLINLIVKTISTKQTNEKINIEQIWQKQSPEIHKGLLYGWDDNTTTYGFCNSNGHNATRRNEKLQALSLEIIEIHKKQLPDGN